MRTASGQVLTPPRRLIIDVVKQKSKKHSRVWFHEQIDKQARNQLCDSFCSNASARPAFRQLGRAMGAGCSRRTRGHLRTASGWERLRPRPSVAERWALLIRKARGLQILTARVVFRRWDETSRAADAGMITGTLGTFIDDRESFAGDSECTDTWDLVPPSTPETETNEYAGSQGPSSSGTASGQDGRGTEELPCMHGLHRNCVRPHMQKHHATSKMPPEFAQPQARICTATDRLQDIEERLTVLEECRRHGLWPVDRVVRRWSYLVDRVLRARWLLMWNEDQGMFGCGTTRAAMFWCGMVWRLIRYHRTGDIELLPPRPSVIERAKQWSPFIPPKWSPFVPPGHSPSCPSLIKQAELEDSCAVAINPWHVGKVFITPKGKGKKWHAEYGCSGAVTPVTRGGIEVRRRDPCLKCVPTQVV